MNIGILCNFGPGIVSGIPQIGGSENVIENISKLLIRDYNYEVNIYAFNYDKKDTCHNINIIPCGKNNKLIDQINSYTKILIYSDSFWGLNSVLDNINKIKPKITLVLVGAYFLKSHPEYLKILKSNINKFNLVVHSRITPDYKFCVENNLPVSVIPNGISTEEFKINKINFLEKYKIKEKYVILSVFNWFYGKGFNKLTEFYRSLEKELKDFIIIQVSSSIKYPYEKRFLEKCQYECRNMNIKFLRNIPREDVVSAFNNSDIYLNLSFKEVSPLILYESRASSLPFVSSNVGNSIEQKGGIIIVNNNEDEKGYKIVDKQIIDKYVDSIIRILTNNSLRERLIREGQEDIKQYDWKNIVPEYNKLFKN